MDIASWLRNLRLSQYEPAFLDNAIDAGVLPDLTQDDLRDLGVTLIGHRRKLMAAIEELRIARISAADSLLGSGPPAARDLPRSALGGAAAAAERRRVTVMFYDLVGSTTLSTLIDPEELREVVGAYHRRVGEVLTRFGGFVARIMGDGGLVYFGYPEAHEDDPERAVLAALGAVGAVEQLDE